MSSQISILINDTIYGGNENISRSLLEQVTNNDQEMTTEMIGLLRLRFITTVSHLRDSIKFSTFRLYDTDGEKEAQFKGRNPD